MKEFDYFLKNGDVRKVSRDIELAKSLVNDMNERINKASLLDSEVFAKIVYENFYDALRDFSDAVLAVKGFKSYSHQASISYLRKVGFSESIIMDLDNFRYKRNSSKYYGEVIFSEDSEDIKKFYKKINGDIKKILEELGI